ncbi:acyl-CoA thioesterase [Sphingomonas montanisoli]|uniref:Uncharacterized protein n=1 Tax=Sphingomonas montanisoli TaxID=2606412 RepID=A0A5D9C2T1_9SPHN|nr:thioesterase family protein [Sphingomonas montanisoli]TZG26044.1 hypothetical protein FYJ91_13845 [Sphingomonas montanisoli]
MQRLDRNRLIGRTFPFAIDIPVRFDDLDIQAHVNNVAVAVIFEEARARFNRENVLADWVASGGSAVVAGVQLEFAGEMEWHPLHIRTGVLEVGRSSFLLGQIASQHGIDTAFAETMLVTTRDGGSAPFPDAVRAKLEGALIV